MDIGIFIEVDQGSYSKWQCINFVSELMKTNLAHIDYGAISHYTFICKALKTIKGFEKYTAVQRPRFTEHKRWQLPDKGYVDVYGLYRCEFKIDFDEYDHFITTTDTEAKRIIAHKVVESLSNLDRLSKKAAAFDKERFKADIISLFRKNGLL